MGLSRDTFYRYKAAVGNGGIEALIDKSRRKPNIKNRVEEMTEAAVIAYAVEQPAYGQVRASNELRKQGNIHLPKRGALCLAASSAGAVQGSLRLRSRALALFSLRSHAQNHMAWRGVGGEQSRRRRALRALSSL